MLQALPKVGTAEHAHEIWSGWNWPIAEGGLESTENDRLSPLAKLELISGHEFRDERIDSKRQNNVKWWYGYCDSIVSAAANYTCEPNATEFKLNENLMVHFNREEMKGILAYFFSHSTAKPSTFFGSKKETVSAAEFHLALTNRVGIQHLPIGMVYGGDATEIHNHLIKSYKTNYGTKTESSIEVFTSLTYSPELAEPSHNLATAGISKELLLHYLLETDSNGKILVGKKSKWLSEENPKFLWITPQYRVETDSSVPAQIKELISQSIAHCK